MASATAEKAVYAYSTSEPVRKKKPVQYDLKFDKRTSELVLKRKYHPLVVEIPFILGFVLSTGLMVLSCCRFIQVNSDLRYQVKELASLEASLLTFRANNDAAEHALIFKGDFDDLSRDAKKLGLAPVQENQIRYFARSDSGYVVQEADIPD